MTQNKSILEDSKLPTLEWVDDVIPKSVRFDDTYYSKADGLAETRHVFLDGNNLPGRFANAEQFTICETGFGTGLNFLATKELWQTTAPTSAQLHYVSFEQYPMNAASMKKALSHWPELEKSADQLTAVWQPEFEFLDTEFGNIRLTVFFSDANTRLPQLDIEADAWFLDGFSPAKNPELWNETLMHDVGRHTKPGGTFATYTSAGFVRRNLQAAGFRVEKTRGHSGKREMSIGKKTET